MNIEQLNRIHHVAIPVKDIKRAVDWYTERFRCEIMYQDDTWAMIRFENINLAFVSREQHPPHIAFELENAAEFGSLQSHRDGTRSTYIKDSENNDVEIMAKDS